VNDSIRAALLLAAVFGPMLVEASRASRNERLQIARGGQAVHGDVYDVMRVVYPASFLAMIVEGWLRAFAIDRWTTAGFVVFVAAKLLKVWAIRSLGQCWTFRVIVVPGARLVSEGPYRFLRHPNYVAVIGEFVGVGMMAGAVATGPLAVTLFGFLIALRVGVETRALDAATAKSSKNHNRP